MADEKEKVTKQDINGPFENKTPELSAEELDKVAGGDVHTGLSTGKKQ